MLYNGRSHLLVYESSRFQDELLRVVLKLIEHRFFDLHQDLHNGFPRQPCSLYHFSNKVIFDTLTDACRVFAGIGMCTSFPSECFACL